MSGSSLPLFTDPANQSGLPTMPPGWYTMAGHFDDPAASACVRTDGLNAGSPRPATADPSSSSPACAPGLDDARTRFERSAAVDWQHIPRGFRNRPPRPA